jgi:hydrogenase nickel insertion protein HypA
VHELSIALKLWELCQADRAAHGEASIQSVRIAVGELASVDPKMLEYAWTDVAAGAGVAAPALTIAWCPVRQSCARCGEVAERQAGSWLRLCPTCAEPLRVEGGDELDLLGIDFEEHTGVRPC